MNLSEFCIKRPVFTTVLSLILIVAGLMGYSYLTTRFMPKFEPNSISISASYPGASADLIEKSITTPIEQAISGVEGIDTVTSSSMQGTSSITVTTLTGFNIYEITNQIRNKIAMHAGDLPNNLQPPVVQTGGGSMNLMDISFTDTKLTPEATRDYLERFVINQIEQISGVANVQTMGANQYAMRIWINPERLAQSKLGVNDITTAIANNNVELPAGKISGDSISYPITANTKLSTAEQFGNIILANQDGHLIRLQDVAKVELGGDNASKTIIKINGENGVLLSVYNTNDANPISTADAIRHYLAGIESQLPAPMKMQVTFDQSSYMKASVHEVYQAIFFAIFCVGFVIFIFLGKFRSVIVPIATIPVCLISSFAIIYFFGFTIDMLTLLALVLSIGLVVDDAIVMLENIYRHIENGMKPYQAAIVGSKEITFSVIAMTLTLAAVYAPIGLIQGQVSMIVKSFAFTLAGAVIISGFVALTLSPMMCARLLPENITRTGYSHYLENIFLKLSHHYQTILRWVLQRRYLIVIITLVFATGGVFIFKSIPKAFVPAEDMGFLISTVSVPSGANIDLLQKQLDTITNIILKNPATDNTVTVAMDQSGGFDLVFTDLKPYDQRKDSATKVADDVNNETAKLPFINGRTFSPSFGGSTQNQLAFYLIGAVSYKDLYDISQKLIKTLNNYPGLKNINNDMNFNSQQYSLTVNRTLASQMGVNVKDIDTTIAALLGGTSVSTFDIDGRDYNVFIQSDASYHHSVQAFDQFFIKNTLGQEIPLSNLITLTPVLTQQTLPHYNRQRATLISAQLAPGYKIGTAIEYLQQQLPTLLPSNIKYAFTGSAKQIQDASGHMGTLFLLALVFIILVLAAQFESFLDPFIILLAVPLCIVGALASLKLVDGSINLYTLIGLVTLVGLIAKHGILITKFANQLRDEGKAIHDALIEAATIRLRPILMTTAAMVFGALPLVLASGASANSRREIGIVIIGGLIIGTFFSLIVVPVAYSFANQARASVKRLLR